MVITAASMNATPWRCGKRVGLRRSAAKEPKPPIQVNTTMVEATPAMGSESGSTRSRNQMKVAATSMARISGRAATPLL